MNIGDTVWLKSGGPALLIECDLGDGQVFCTWRGLGEQHLVFGAAFRRSSLTTNPESYLEF